MKILPIVFSFVSIGWGALADGALASEQDVKEFLKSNLVAAVVGYQTTREVSDDIRIPLFTPAVEASKTNAYGVLFYVIAPTNYANYYFYLDGEDRFNASETVNYYRPDEFYWFSLSEKGPDYDVRRLLFLLPWDCQKRMRLSQPNNSRFFVSKISVEKELDRLVRRKKERMDELSRQEDALKKSITKEERKQSRSQFLTTKAALISLEFYEKDASRQKGLVKEQWKALRSSIPPGFAWGDLSYWEELRKE